MFRSSGDFDKYPCKYWANNKGEKDIHWHEPPAHLHLSYSYLPSYTVYKQR